jgi:HEPN domain-containing protein
LKAVLEEYAGAVPKIHDLDRLFIEARKYIDLDKDAAVVNKLNTLYIESRYPGAFGFLPYGKPTSADVKSFHAFAETIYNTVRNHLES